jgi:hypothetical protein
MRKYSAKSPSLTACNRSARITVAKSPSHHQSEKVAPKRRSRKAGLITAESRPAPRPGSRDRQIRNIRRRTAQYPAPLFLETAPRPGRNTNARKCFESQNFAAVPRCAFQEGRGPSGFCGIPPTPTGLILSNRRLVHDLGEGGSARLRGGSRRGNPSTPGPSNASRSTNPGMGHFKSGSTVERGGCQKAER